MDKKLQMKESSRGGKFIKCRNKRRPEPYSVDMLPSLEKLSLSDDTPHEPNKRFHTAHEITNSQIHVAKPSVIDKTSSEMAKVRRNSKVRLKAAMLKLHHHQLKDRKCIIRCARLKLIKCTQTNRQCTDVVNAKSNYKPLCNNWFSNSKVFGATSNDTCADFGFVFSSNSTYKSTCSDKTVKNGAMFDNYRCKGITKGSDKLNLSELKLDLPVDDTCTNASNPSGHGVKGHDLSPYELSVPDSERYNTLTCSQEARRDDMSVDELASYLDDFVYIPKKMSSMAEMMYT